MLRYICKRVVGVVPALIIVVTFVFFFVRLIPGDPARQVAGPRAAKEDAELIRGQLGPDKSLPQQYISYVTELVKEDSGTSLRAKRPILTEAQGRYVNTVQLTLLSLTWSVIAGVLIGVWSGRNRSKWQGYTGMTMAVSGISMPFFWIGLILIMAFAVKYRLLPTTEADSFKNLVLPSITSGVSIAAITVRFTRSSIIEMLKEDYVRTTRAKGLREKTAIWKHVFRSCMISVMMIVGLRLGFLLSGSIVTETVFAFPGFGSLLIESVNYRGYPTIRSLILIFSLHFVLINLIMGILYVVLSPEVQSN